jgi:hypothetical protein
MNISLINPNLIHIDLSNIIKNANEGYFHLNFSISNDNITFSKPITLTAYDSRLYNCYEDSTCVKIEVNYKYYILLIIYFYFNIFYN